MRFGPLFPRLTMGVEPGETIGLLNVLLQSSGERMTQNVCCIAVTHIIGKDFGLTQIAWSLHVFPLRKYRRTLTLVKFLSLKTCITYKCQVIILCQAEGISSLETELIQQCSGGFIPYGPSLGGLLSCAEGFFSGTV